MSYKNLFTLQMVSGIPEKREAFNNNFESVTILHSRALFFRKSNVDICPELPISVKEIGQWCGLYDHTVDEVRFVIYTSTTIHIVFSDDECLTIIVKDGVTTHLITKTAEKSWMRLQGFLYKYTSRTVSHAKRAPLSEDGKLSLDQFINKYK